MNYDIDFKVKLEGVDRWVYLDPCCDAVITSSASEMIRKSTGLSWDACGNNGLCIDVIPKIEKGLKELKQHPEKYNQYEEPNEWVTVEIIIKFFERILDEWDMFKRIFPDLEEIVTFWIY